MDIHCILSYDSVYLDEYCFFMPYIHSLNMWISQCYPHLSLIQQIWHIFIFDWSWISLYPLIVYFLRSVDHIPHIYSFSIGIYNPFFHVFLVNWNEHSTIYVIITSVFSYSYNSWHLNWLMDVTVAYNLARNCMKKEGSDITYKKMLFANEVEYLTKV